MTTNNMMILLDNVKVDGLKQSVNKIEQVQAAINQTLKAGHDFDTIPGTQKPTLLKPGAEKILMMFGLKSEYEIISMIEDWEKGVFSYTVKCILSHGEQKITEGLGSCNSLEDKYRYRWVFDRDVPAGVNLETLKTRTTRNGGVQYQIENNEIYSQVNTLLKMAKKRAQVDATLTVASLSEVFTQDMEDIKDFNQQEQIQNLNETEAKNIRLTFGKYKGMALGEVMETDTSYVEWLKDYARDNYLKAAAHNLLQEGEQEHNEKINDEIEKSEDEYYGDLKSDDIPF